MPRALARRTTARTGDGGTAVAAAPPPARPRTVTIGVIGCGHWGPNHIRNFSVLDGVTVAGCADLSDERLQVVKRHYPAVKRCRDYREILADPDVNAVVVTTPAASHYEIVKESLERDKDVLCEKPLALSSREADTLVRLAQARGRILMVGHTFLFNVGIQKLKASAAEGLVGRIHYLHSTRTNLGPIRDDTNVVWDLASHDVSIFSYLLGGEPTAVSAKGESYLRKGIEDVAFISLSYPPNILAHIQISWIHPQKVRSITVVGDKKMMVWDDLNNLEPIRIYDKGVTQEPYYESYGEFHLLLREGDVVMPKLHLVEPLKLQSEHFIECVTSRRASISDGRFGLHVVRVLEAIEESMKRGGAPQGIRS